MAVKTQALKTLLVVGLSDSIHTIRWLKMLSGQGFRIVLVPAYETRFERPQPYRKVSTAEELEKCSDQEHTLFDLDSVTSAELSNVTNSIEYQQFRPKWLGDLVLSQPGHVVAAILRFRPVLIHSMVVQLGGYLTLGAKEYLQDKFPTWLLSNWGSDIFLYQAVPEHRSRILRIVSFLDAYHAECERDVAIIRQLGFRGFHFPTIPASGGMNFSEFPPVSSFPPTSKRREIIVKGYHGWAGRALHILSALHLCADALRGYKIRLILSSPEVRDVARKLASVHHLDLEIESYLDNHDDALMRLGHARVVIGLGIADGISTTLLEAMGVGAFPIQGSYSCGNEWVESGKTGMLVSPHDVRALADAIRKAATDDLMVDAAAIVNRRTVEQRWNSLSNARIALDGYRTLMSQESEFETSIPHSHAR